MSACRVQVLDDDPDAFPALVIQCRNCPAEETMNDEEGGCDLADLARWEQDHECPGDSRP